MKHKSNIDYLSNKEYLTLNEASLFLGISKSQLYKLTSLKVIRHYKPHGKLIYFDRSDLIQWIKSCEIHSEKELIKIVSKFK